MNARWAALAFAFAAGVQAQAPPDLVARAEGGDAQAQSELGEKYLLGDGMPEDRAAAWKWLNRAAAQGDAPAQYRLAQLCIHLDLTQDSAIPHDPKHDYEADAHSWYAKAAAQDYAPAEFALGSYAVGKTEFGWYLRAAQHGYRRALMPVAMAYADGRGTAQNFGEALRWYKAAAARGDAAAAFRIAALYRQGMGVPQDAAEAERWLHQAADAGNPSAIALLRSAQQPAPLHCAAAATALRPIAPGSALVLFAAPDAAGSAEPLVRKDGEPSPLADFRLRAGELTITLRQRQNLAPATDAGDDLIAYGGGDARIRGDDASDGAGAIAVEWQDVARTHASVVLRVEYRAGAAAAACALVRSARLLDPVSELRVTHVEKSAKPCATLRNGAGEERRVCVGDTVTRDLGKIAAITPAGVDLVELLPNERGGWKESAITLPLQR